MKSTISTVAFLIIELTNGITNGNTTISNKGDG